MDIYYRAKERNPKTVTKHIVMLNFIDRTNLEKIHLHLCKKKKKNTMGTGRIGREIVQKKCSSNI
jgi:hypothetical protein